MLHVGGRGGAHTTISVGLNTKHWHAEAYYDSANDLTSYYADPNWWATITPGYGPGVLLMRFSGTGKHQCRSAPPPPYYYFNIYTSTLSRLTFISPDGTE